MITTGESGGTRGTAAAPARGGFCSCRREQPQQRMVSSGVQQRGACIPHPPPQLRSLFASTICTNAALHIMYLFTKLCRMDAGVDVGQCLGVALGGLGSSASVCSSSSSSSIEAAADSSSSQAPLLYVLVPSRPSYCRPPLPQPPLSLCLSLSNQASAPSPTGAGASMDVIALRKGTTPTIETTPALCDSLCSFCVDCCAGLLPPRPPPKKQVERPSPGCVMPLGPTQPLPASHFDRCAATPPPRRFVPPPPLVLQAAGGRRLSLLGSFDFCE